MQNEKDQTTMLNILKKVKLFEGLDDEILRKIIDYITLDYYPKDQLIFSEGDLGDYIYIIFSGTVRVFPPADTPSLEEEVAIFGTGDFFGEMALLSEFTRTASAITKEESELFKMNKEGLEKMMTNIPSIGEHVSGEFLRRFKENMRKEQQ